MMPASVPSPEHSAQPGGAVVGVPVALTSLVGRDAEAAELVGLLTDGEARLVTLVGPGGVGKTRLAARVAVAAASSFADGVRFVQLAAESDPAAVPGAVALALGVRDDQAGGVLPALVAALRERQILLVLDNFEQVVDAAAFLAPLLAECPRLTILATSRVLLRVSGERGFPVAPLSVEVDAVQLFVDRAQAVNPRFSLSEPNIEDVAAICRRLDGLPLAIELAAARINLLAPAGLLARLSTVLPVLAGGPRDAPARHRTIRDTVAWSYDLLDPETRTLFRALAVFAGGFGFEAVERVVASGDEFVDVFGGIAALVDHSLVRQEPTEDGTVRYHLLETIRAYALERLEAAGEAAERRAGLLAWALEFVAAIEPDLVGASQAEVLTRLDADHANLRGALDWAARHDPGAGLRVATGLAPYWLARGYLHEGRQRLDALLGSSGLDPSVRAVGQISAAELAYAQGDVPRALELVDEAVRLAESRSDEATLAPALDLQANALRRTGDLAGADAVNLRAIEIRRTLGDEKGTGRSWMGLGSSAYTRGDLTAANEQFETALSRYRQVGNLPGQASALNNLGLVAVAMGEPARALPLFEQALTIERQRGDRTGVAAALANLARAVRELGDPATAETHTLAALATFREIGDRWGIAVTLHNLGTLAVVQGDHERAIELLGESLALRRELGNPAAISLTLWELGEAELLAGQVGPAEARFVEYRQIAEDRGDDSLMGYADRRLATVALARGEQDRAAQLGRELLARHGADGPTGEIAGFLEMLAAALVETNPTRAARLYGAAAALRERVPTSSSVLDTDIRERTLVRLERMLAPDPLARAIDAGRRLTVAQALLEATSDQQAGGRGHEPERFGLTEREIEVLRLIVDGRPDREIADELFVSPRTVGGHVANILNKLGLNSRAAAAAFAVRHGLV